VAAVKHTDAPILKGSHDRSDAPAENVLRSHQDVRAPGSGRPNRPVEKKASGPKKRSSRIEGLVLGESSPRQRVRDARRGKESHLGRIRPGKKKTSQKRRESSKKDSGWNSEKQRQRTDRKQHAKNGGLLRRTGRLSAGKPERSRGKKVTASACLSGGETEKQRENIGSLSRTV